MDSTKSRDYLIEAVIDHCLVFSDHLEPLKSRQYVSQFPIELLTTLERLNSAIREKLESMIADPDFQSLTEAEAEQNILRYSMLYSYLCNAASIIERSDVSHTVIEMVQPIKRLMQLKCGLKNFQLLLHPLPIMNYSFYHLGIVLSEIKRTLALPRATISFPKHLITVGFPGLEMGRILSHAIVAHELGHCLYIEYRLKTKILRRIKPDKNKLNELITSLVRVGISTQVDIRSDVTKGINDLAELWVKELTCDAIGYLLFGPSYLFAALNILPMVYSLDYDRGSHPPNRMRFLLLYQMLDKEKEFFDIIDSKVDEFLGSWKSILNSRGPQFTNRIRGLTGNAILNIYDDIINVAKLAIKDGHPYSASEHAVELQRLADRAENFIPPNEIIDGEVPSVVDFPSILNAGWLVYLKGLTNIQTKYNLDPRDCKIKFNELISWAIEANESQKRWKEVQ